MANKIIFSVKDAGGTYTTQTVHGKRSSSTSGYRPAAEALAGKLYPHQEHELTLVDSSAHGVQVFELELLA